MRIEPLGDIAPLSAFNAIKGLSMPFIFGGEAYGQRRYSYAGAEPFVSLKTTGPSDPFDAASKILAEFKPLDAGPFPFNGGAAGYFAYDLKDIIFKKTPSMRPGGLNLPLCAIGIYDTVYVYDHPERTGYLLTHGLSGKNHKRFKEAVLDASSTGMCAPLPPASSGFTSNTPKERYLASVRKAQEYIAEGDIYQINLSHRLRIPWEGAAGALYSSLLKNKPATFSSYFDFNDFQLVSNSPERLLKAEGGYIETSPIKGTRPRGKTPNEDKRLIEALRRSPKERAEHVMIVDLERNDIGQVAVAGTVEVAGFEAIETFPGLHHMISTVRGRIKPDISPVECLKAVFPGGSVTGAPKMRAMEIIDEIEVSPREIYTGAVGWIGFNGNMDMSMAIRTAVYKDGMLYLNVGGGIVADSAPEDEYDETILKAGDFLEALGAEASPEKP